ncbi:MAG: hypothetical protein E7365_02940 [Clostridiales bacterium]|nr:hypothetical protein [Clostridiales bacterium]
MELWSREHALTLIPAVIIMLGICVLLRIFLIKKDIKYRMIPFQIIAVLLFLIEVGKQVYSFKHGYDLYHLPFHFCSLFIFMLAISAFYKGKYREIVFSVTAAICCATFLLMMIYPCLIYSAANIVNYFSGYLDFHTVTFHNMVIFEFFAILFLNLNSPKSKRDTKPIIFFMAGFSVVAATMSQLLKTNYANMYSCNIPPLESVRILVQNACGYMIAQIMYVSIVMLLHILFTLMAYHLYRFLKSILFKKP